MEREKLIKGLQKLEAVFSSLFWKGEKEHPEKNELLDTIREAISLLQPQPIEDEKVKAAIEHYKQYKFIPQDMQQVVIDYILSNNLAVGMSRQRLIEILDMYVQSDPAKIALAYTAGYTRKDHLGKIADIIIAEGKE